MTFNIKQNRLAEALRNVLRTSNGENLFRLIQMSIYVLRPAEGLGWDEIIDVLEKETKEDLSKLRPLKCPKCKSGLNFHGKCVNLLCPSKALEPSNPTVPTVGSE